jgi:drug/metabolite transporter (DMT)-like permease
MVKVVAIWGVIAIASAIMAGILAGMKRRDHSFWAAWAFLIPPLLLILILLPTNPHPPPRRPTADEEDRQAW